MTTDDHAKRCVKACANLVPEAVEDLFRACKRAEAHLRYMPGPRSRELHAALLAAIAKASGAKL